MKPALAIIVVLALGLTACAPRELKVSAKLIVPGEFALRGMQADGPMTVTFEWNEDDPVQIPVWKPGPTMATAKILGEWQVYYPDGKLVEEVAAIGTLVDRPNASIVGRRGEHLKMTFSPYSLFTFKQPGTYRVVAQFHGTTLRGTRVTFVCGEETMHLVTPKS